VYRKTPLASRRGHGLLPTERLIGWCWPVKTVVVVLALNAYVPCACRQVLSFLLLRQVVCLPLVFIWIFTLYEQQNTYLLTPWCRVLLEKLTGLQLVKKFPAFHGTRIHYRTHKRPPPVSILGQPNPVHIPTSHLLEMRPNIIHPSTPRSRQWSPSLRFPHINTKLTYLVTYLLHGAESFLRSQLVCS